METGESILDAIFDEDSLEDVQEVEMMDVEGVLVEQDSQSDLGQNIGRDCRAEKQSCSKSRRRRSKKKNREKKASSGQKVTDINRFVLDTGRRLQEKETYLMHTAVGCLGISALDDLVKEVNSYCCCRGREKALRDPKKYHSNTSNREASDPTSMALEPKDFTTRSVGAHSASQLLSLSRNSMDQIQHRYVEVNGLKLHVAETGTGLAVVMFLHGFPEIWYSWRHQMIVVANAGYKAIAPDYRGYRLSDLPLEPENASLIDSVHDMVTLLDALDIPK